MNADNQAMMSSDVDEHHDNSTAVMGTISLTNRSGTEIRSDLLDSAEEPVTWESAVTAFDRYHELCTNENAVLESETESSLLEYTGESDRADLMRLEQVNDGFRSDNPLVHTYEFLFTGQCLQNGSYVPVLDFKADLDQSWEKIRKRLYDVVSGDYWYCLVRDASDTGYPFNRLILQSSAAIDDADVADLFDLHVEHCPIVAGDTVSVDTHARHERSIDVASRCEARLNEFGANRTSSWSANGFLAALWADGTPRMMFSKTANDYIDVPEPAYEPELIEYED